MMVFNSYVHYFLKYLTHCLQKQRICAAPCKPHHRDTHLRVSPYKKSVKQQPISTTSFRPIGSLHLKLADLHQQPPWILSKVRSYVLLPPNYDLSAQYSRASMAEHDLFILYVSQTVTIHLFSLFSA